jgi:hypothetical protein
MPGWLLTRYPYISGHLAAEDFVSLNKAAEGNGEHLARRKLEHRTVYPEEVGLNSLHTARWAPRINGRSGPLRR